MQAQSLAPPCRPPPLHSHTPPKEQVVAGCFSPWRQILIALQILANTIANPQTKKHGQGQDVPGRLGPGCSAFPQGLGTSVRAES